MLSNPPVLKTLGTPSTSTGCPNHFRVSSKLLELGMRGLGTSSLRRGKVDTTLFTKKMNGEIFICQVYVDDIIFSSTNVDFCKEFGDLMCKEI